MSLITVKDGIIRERDQKHSDIADKLIFLKRKHKDGNSGTQKNFWLVIDEVVNMWKEMRPHEYKSIIVQVKDTRDTAYNEFGEAAKGKGSGSLRRTLDIPVFVDRAIRCLYSPEELPFDKRFFEAFWKRYRIFRVSEKV